MWSYSHRLSLHLTLVVFGNPLQACTKTFKCAHRLALRHPADERPADERADRPEWRTELVAVVKAGAAVVRAQDVFAVRMRARRAASLPHGELARTAVDERPVNLQAHPAHVDPLIHRVPDAWRAVVGVQQLAVNRD